MPADALREDLADIIAWLGELVRQVDSSLLDEWEELAAGKGAPIWPPNTLPIGAHQDRRS